MCMYASWSAEGLDFKSHCSFYIYICIYIFYLLFFCLFPACLNHLHLVLRLLDKPHFWVERVKNVVFVGFLRPLATSPSLVFVALIQC